MPKYNIQEYLNQVPSGQVKAAKAELVARLGISDRQFRRLCKGESEVKVDHLVVVADFFGISIDELINKEQISQPAASFS